MSDFELAFPIVMIILPALFGLFMRVQPSEEPDGAAPRRAVVRWRWQLCAWTVAALALYGALRWIGSGGSPIIDEIADFMWLACFPLWFAGPMRRLQAASTAWRPRGRAATTVVASLERRDALSTALGGLQMAAWILWAILALATLVILLNSAAPHWWLLLLTGLGGLELRLGDWLARSAGLEPEPLDPAASPDLRAAYAALRRLKQWSWFASAALAMLLLAVIALLMAWNGDTRPGTAIWIGVAGSILLGSTGATIGAIADSRRAGIIRRYRELTTDAAV
jgi:hypothetical protein